MPPSVRSGYVMTKVLPSSGDDQCVIWQAIQWDNLGNGDDLYCLYVPTQVINYIHYYFNETGQYAC